VLTQSWRSKSAVFRIYCALTSNGYSKSIYAVRRQRNLGLDPCEQRKCFLQYFEDLSIPKDKYTIYVHCLINILPSESGVTLHYSTFCLRSYYSAIWLPFFKHLSRDYEKTTITAMYHGRWFAYKQTNKYLYCQS
jgi:hypothetical protein